MIGNDDNKIGSNDYMYSVLRVIIINGLGLPSALYFLEFVTYAACIALICMHSSTWVQNYQNKQP